MHNINTGNIKRRSTRGSCRSVRKRERRNDTETRVVRIVSLGAIVSGAAVCLASVGVGLSLMLVATVILAEL
jgi:hypothetical protein